jgi:hypothetical protein
MGLQAHPLFLCARQDSAFPVHPFGGESPLQARQGELCWQRSETEPGQRLDFDPLARQFHSVQREGKMAVRIASIGHTRSI